MPPGSGGETGEVITLIRMRLLCDRNTRGAGPAGGAIDRNDRYESRVILDGRRLTPLSPPFRVEQKYQEAPDGHFQIIGGVTAEDEQAISRRFATSR
jgi:hypothetical protein